jgi:hypothetical protein
MYRFYVLLFFFLFQMKKSLPQGLNNPYSIDQKDLNNLLSLQGIEVFKFPLQNKQPVNYINCIIYQYEKGILTDSINLYKNLEKTKELLGNDILPHTTKNQTFLRFYFQKSDSVVHLLIDLDGFQQTMTFDFKNIVLQGARAFDMKINPLNTRKRILAYYGIKDEDAELHCSGNAGNEELIQRYDNLILVYIEPVRLSHF